MIFIIGPHCVGKTECAKMLSSRGFYSIDTGPSLRKYHTENNSLSFYDWCSEGERNDPDFTNKIVVKMVDGALNAAVHNNAKDLLVVGVRSWGGICYIQKNASNPRGLWQRNYIIRVDAPLPLLFERYRQREHDCSEERFRELQRRDEEIGINTIYGKEDFVINNNGSISGLQKSLDELIKKMEYEVCEAK